MKLESIEKLVKEHHCPCEVINRLNRKGIKKVTIEQIESFLSSLKRDRYQFTGNLDFDCQSGFYNFIHALKSAKGEKFFEELKDNQKKEVESILQGKKCLE